MRKIATKPGNPYGPWLSSHGGLVAGVDREGNFGVWRRATGERVLVGDKHPSSVAFTSDEKVVAVTYPRIGGIYYNIISNEASKFSFLGNAYESSISPNGDVLAIGSWDPNHGHTHLTLIDTSTMQPTLSEYLDGDQQMPTAKIRFDRTGAILFVSESLDVQIRTKNSGWKKVGKIASSTPIENIRTADDGILFSLSGSFSGKTSSIESRRANIIQVYRVELHGHDAKSTQVDRVEFPGVMALRAVSVDAFGWLNIVSETLACGVFRIPWSNRLMLDIAKDRLNGLPEKLGLMGALEDVQFLREMFRMK